jgi:iron(II)-dependent oxidoreductase
MAAALVAALLLSGAPAPAQEAAPEGMSPIPGGEFWMGRIQRWMIEEVGWMTRDRMDDLPAHLVEIEPFYIDQKEVTNRDFARFVSEKGVAAPRHWMGGVVPGGEEDHPAYNVSWDDAVAYCEWGGKRLPTEAEWERAARGTVPELLYPWGNEFAPKESPESERGVPMAHNNDPDGPIAVASFPANSFGLHDVTGNVWEWTADWYALHYYSVSPDRNPTGPADGIYRVLRGGSWAERDDRIMAVSYRNFTDPSTKAPTIGFRCAQSLQQ